jgi:PA14 domain/Right handed beta helix region
MQRNKIFRQMALVALIAAGSGIEFFAFVNDANAQTSPKPFCPAGNFSLGAKIDESKVNAFVYVDINGNDANDGAATKPVRTFCKGMARANEAYRSGKSPKVVVRPGTYYGETCGIGGSPELDGTRPYVIEGTEPGKVVISGSTPWKNWSGPDANGVWFKPWTNKWRQEFVAAGDGGENALATCTPPRFGCAPLEARRLEMVNVDGQKYYHASSIAALTDATFFVDESQGRINVKPPKGVDLNDPSRLVLVLENKNQIIFMYRGDKEAIKSNLVLRNLVIANTAGNGLPEWSGGAWLSSAIQIQNLDNTLIENVTFLANRDTGLLLFGNSNTVKNSKFIDNGILGLSAGYGEGLLVEDSTLRLNGKVSQLGKWDWTSAGIKTYCSRNAVYRRLDITDNFVAGFWTDTGVVNSKLSDSTINNNALQGVFHENNNRVSQLGGVNGDGSANACGCLYEWRDEPTLTVQNTKVNFNQGSGVLITESENTILDGVELIGNQRAIATYGVECGPTSGDPLQVAYSGPCRGPMRNFSWQRSFIAATAPEQRLFAFDEGGIFNDAQPWKYEIFPGLKLDSVYDTNNNRYFHPNGESANEFFDENGVRNKNFAGWKALTAGRKNVDYASYWQAPNFPVSTGTGNGLNAVYFNDLNFSGATVTRVDATVNFDFRGVSNISGVDANTFSARWTGEIQAKETGVYVFRITGDDAIRLYVDDVLIASDWGANHAAKTTESPRIFFTAGKRRKIKIEYSQSYGSALAKLEWKRPTAGSRFEVVPQSQLYSSTSIAY